MENFKENRKKTNKCVKSKYFFRKDGKSFAEILLEGKGV